jgi:UDP-glucose:(glucosyl)LPS alpha-1,3-glucosyltransferase
MLSSGGAVVVRHALSSPASARDRFGPTALLRFELPERLPDVDRVIYLDADTLVGSSLDELSRVELGGLRIAAVANVLAPDMRARVAALGITDHRDFFNSGVLVMDLAAMRASGDGEQLIEMVRARDDLLWPDQDALNIVYAGRWKRLHPRYNAMNSLWTWSAWAEDVFGPQASEARRDPAILHFEGPHIRKPWHYLSTHPWTERYRETLARTPWGSTPPEDETPTTRVIRRLPEAWRVPAYIWLLRVRRRLRAAPGARALSLGRR